MGKQKKKGEKKQHIAFLTGSNKHKNLHIIQLLPRPAPHQYIFAHDYYKHWLKLGT